MICDQSVSFNFNLSRSQLNVIQEVICQQRFFFHQRYKVCMSNYFTIPRHPPPSPYRITYQIHTDLLHVQVRLVVNGHSSVTVIFCAKSCPGRVYLRIKWVMIFFTSLGKNVALLQWYVNVRNFYIHNCNKVLDITSDFPAWPRLQYNIWKRI